MGLSHASKKCCPGWGSIHENGVCVGELLDADAAGGVEEIVEDFGVVADEDDVVVADAVAQEVGSRLVEVEAHLGAAHVVVVEVLLEVGGGDEVAVEVGAAYFDYGDFALGKCTLDGYAAERLEVVAEDEALCLVDANGAVGHDHFVAVGVDFGGVGHE